MTEQPGVVRLAEKFAAVEEPWSPRIVAALNDMHVKVARIEGEFVWHAHPDTDELFYVQSGAFVMRYRDRDVALRAGDLHVVPRGVEHCPKAEGPCEILMIERAGTRNTGDAGGARTVADPAWI
ncbi:MAG: cupin domain-containing protein [Pseudomonadota bacterium]